MAAELSPPNRDAPGEGVAAHAGAGDAAECDELDRLVRDLLAERDGPVRLDDLSRELLAQGDALGPTAGAARVERHLLARVVPTLLDEGALAFSPERWTVSRPVASSRRSSRFLGAGSVGLVAAAAVVAGGFGWSLPVVAAVTVALVLSLGAFARRRARRVERPAGLVRSFDPGAAPDPATVTVSGGDPGRRILGLLLASGGRLHQQAIVARLGLSEPTVSRHLTSLAEAGHLEKVPVGRQNVVCLPRARPTGVTGAGERTPATDVDAGE